MWYGGELENQNDTFPEMVNALLISSIAIYLILMFQFRSVVDPLVVMAAIPLGLLGASVGLMVTNNPFGFTGFLGIVSLGGVVVRNSIILVDYIRDRMEEGVAIEEAAIEAGERRLAAHLSDHHGGGGRRHADDPFGFEHVVAAGECDCVRIGWFDVLHSRCDSRAVRINSQAHVSGPVASCGSGADGDHVRRCRARATAQPDAR